MIVDIGLPKRTMSYKFLSEPVGHRLYKMEN